jgi:transposase
MDLRLEVLRKEVKLFRKKSPRVLVRLLALIELTKFRQKHVQLGESDYERLAQRLDISGRTLYRWEAAYKRGGVEALVPRKAPGRIAVAIRGHTAKKITEMRKLYNWGAEVIQAHLKLDYGIRISRYRINRFLLKKGLIFRKKCKSTKKKHTKVVSVEHPGQHTQMDVKHLPHTLGNRKKCYSYNFVDHASKWSFKRAYDSYGPSETRDFMQAVLAAAPFAITRSQTDNGVEFTNKYLSHVDNPKPHALDDFCASQGIRHVLIPPGEKELQGLVERSHRQDDEELFHRIRPNNLEELNKLLAKHCEWRNGKRRRKALGWRTSNEFISQYRAKIQHMLWGEQSDEKSIKTQAENSGADELDVLVKKAA